jgi:hypothetical protein
MAEVVAFAAQIREIFGHLTTDAPVLQMVKFQRFAVSAILAAAVGPATHRALRSERNGERLGALVSVTGRWQFLLQSAEILDLPLIRRSASGELHCERKLKFVRVEQLPLYVTLRGRRY